MAEFTVQLTQPAVHDIRLIPGDLQSAIKDGIMGLRQDPLPSPPLKKKLKGFGFPIYRLRIADYRILYRIDQKTITIIRIINRKDPERAIRHLKM